MRPFVSALLTVAVLATTSLAARAENRQEGDPVIDLYLKMKDYAGKMPGLSREGVGLKREWLLEKLRDAIDRHPQLDLKIEDLKLTPGQGVVTLTTNKGISARHELSFRFLPVDWPNRTVNIAFQRKSESLSDNAVARILGNLAINTFAFAAGEDPLSKMSDKLPYAKIEGDVMRLYLDQVPSLAPLLNTQVLGFKPFDHLGIKDIMIEQDLLRIKLGKVGP